MKFESPSIDTTSIGWPFRGKQLFHHRSYLYCIMSCETHYLCWHTIDVDRLDICRLARLSKAHPMMLLCHRRLITPRLDEELSWFRLPLNHNFLLCIFHVAGNTVSPLDIFVTKLFTACLHKYLLRPCQYFPKCYRVALISTVNSFAALDKRTNLHISSSSISSHLVSENIMRNVYFQWSQLVNRNTRRFY